MPFADGGLIFLEYLLIKYPIWFVLLIFVGFPLILLGFLSIIMISAYRRKKKRIRKVIEWEEYLDLWSKQHTYPEEKYKNAPFLKGYLKFIYGMAKVLVKQGYTGFSLTFISLICIGFSFYFFLWGGPFLLLGAAFLFLNGITDNLDGAVANLGGYGSKVGAYYDNMIDMIGDLLLIAGPMLTFLYSPILYRGVTVLILGQTIDFSLILQLLTTFVLIIALIGLYLHPIMYFARYRLEGLGAESVPGGYMGRPQYLFFLTIMAALAGIYAIFLYIPYFNNPYLLFLYYFFQVAYLYTFPLSVMIIFILHVLSTILYLRNAVKLLPKNESEDGFGRH